MVIKQIFFLTRRHGRKQACPVILHASSFGSIERTLWAILENIVIDAEHGAAPIFPFWLSPVHVRVIPVSDKHLDPALELVQRFAHKNIRIDINDRDETLGRKIWAGEKEWIPYLVVMGDREIDSGKLAVRERVSKTQQQLVPEEFVQQIGKQLDGMPFRDLMLPRSLSRRPLFN
jgi:threonyl-tRNA synthetase